MKKWLLCTLCKHQYFKSSTSVNSGKLLCHHFPERKRSIIKHTSSILKSLQSGREEQSRLLFSTASRRQINLVHLSSVVFSFCPPFYISLLISIPAWLASLFGLLTVGSVQNWDTFCYTCIYFFSSKQNGCSSKENKSGVFQAKTKPFALSNLYAFFWPDV